MWNSHYYYTFKIDFNRKLLKNWKMRQFLYCNYFCNSSWAVSHVIFFNVLFFDNISIFLIFMKSWIKQFCFKSRIVEKIYLIFLNKIKKKKKRFTSNIVSKQKFSTSLKANIKRINNKNNDNLIFLSQIILKAN